MSLILGLALVSMPARAEDWPPGATIEKAALVDITPEGFDAVAALIPALLPSSLPVDDVGDSSEGAFGQCWLGGYAFNVAGVNVQIEVTDAEIRPGAGVLDVEAQLLVNVNAPGDTFELYTEALCISDTCDGYVDPFLVTVTTSMALDVVEGSGGSPALDATIGAVDVAYDLASDDIHLDNCAIGTVEDVLNIFGISVYDLLLGQLDGVLQGAVADLGPTLETTLEDAFASASIQQTVDLNGVPLEVSLAPAAVDISPAGMRLQMNGGLEAPAAACVAAFDTGGSPRTDASSPDIGAAPNGITTPYHLGLALSDDFTNQALYAAWRGGLLCQDLGASAGLPLDTSILNLLTGDAFAELFPTSEPIGLRLLPRAAPTSAFGAGHDLDIALNQLDVEFFAELDGRKVRALSVGLDGTVGANLQFDGGTGALAVELDLDAGNLTPSVTYNELVPDANDTILGSFSSAFGNLLDTVVGGLLPDLSFTLPAFNGIGLQDLQMAGTSEWLGGYAFIGSVGYGSPDGGCGSDGCGGGCSGGCAVGGTQLPHPAVFALGALVLLRRRR